MNIHKNIVKKLILEGSVEKVANGYLALWSAYGKLRLLKTKDKERLLL